MDKKEKLYEILLKVCILKIDVKTAEKLILNLFDYKEDKQ